MKIETDKVDPDHSPIFEDIAAQVIAIYIEAILYCNTGIDATTTGAVHNDLTQPTEDTATNLTMTHHIGDITDDYKIKALQVIDPEIAIDHIHNHLTDLQDMNLAIQIHIPAGQEEETTSQKEHKAEVVDVGFSSYLFQCVKYLLYNRKYDY